MMIKLNTDLEEPVIKSADWGLIPYSSAWERQQAILKQLVAGDAEAQQMVFCEHQPVITMGKRTSKENLLCSLAEFQEKGIEIIKSDRGGDVSYHEPGQVVLYTLLNLNFKERNLRNFITALEEVLIKTLAAYKIKGHRIDSRPGVWTSEGKIASIGIRLSRWCTMHGLALNVNNSLEGFKLINPCGFNNIKVTAMHKILNIQVPMNELKELLLDNFCNTLGYRCRS